MVMPSLELNCMSEQADLATAESHNIDHMTNSSVGNETKTASTMSKTSSIGVPHVPDARFNDEYVVAIQMVQGPKLSVNLTKINQYGVIE